MALTWKDLITTILAAAVFGLYYAMSKGMSIPLVSGYRSAILVLLIVGMSMCAFSSANISQGNMFIKVASILGIVAFALIIYGLITGAKIAFTLLTAIILLLWLIATMRHVVGS